MPLAEGQIIANHVLVRKLGSGAFGEVWLVRHVELNDERAMKIPTDPDYVKQLRMEGKVQFSLRHPNIVQTLDLNTSHDPPYFLMEYVAGSDLRKKLKAQGKLLIQEGVPILMQILEALAAAHSDGVLHRDLKPENILITPKGQVKVADFGLGKVQAAVASKLILSGNLMSSEGNSISGTIEYMSPEQKEGADPDERDDLYAAGIIACELLTGQRPMPAGIAKMLQRADVDQRFVPVIEKALEFERAERYRSAVEMLQALANMGVVPTRRGSTGVSRGPITNSIGMRFVTILPGEFMMGGELEAEEVVKRFGGEAQWYKVEKPQHRVRITRAYYLGAHEVTRGQFAAFVKDTDYRTDAEKGGTGRGMSKEGWKEQSGLNWKTPGIDQTDAHPVVQVSWNDAVAFCAWLSRKEGKKYRLSTEAEWEYACRAGKQTIFPWGDTIDEGKRYANMADEAASKWLEANYKLTWKDAVPWNDGFAVTAPVGSFKPNDWGLYDMIGNAWEWCHDAFQAYPEGEAVDPKVDGDEDASRVLRGGSWISNPQLCRAAFRNLNGAPDDRISYLGFRCALDFP